MHNSPTGKLITLVPVNLQQIWTDSKQAQKLISYFSSSLWKFTKNYCSHLIKESNYLRQLTNFSYYVFDFLLHLLYSILCQLTVIILPSLVSQAYPYSVYNIPKVWLFMPTFLFSSANICTLPLTIILLFLHFYCKSTYLFWLGNSFHGK